MHNRCATMIGSRLNRFDPQRWAMIQVESYVRALEQVDARRQSNSESTVDPRSNPQQYILDSNFKAFKTYLTCLM